MHIELDGFGLLLVLEMVISQQVVDLINDWRCRSTTLREAGGLKERVVEIKIKHLFNKHDSQ